MVWRQVCLLAFLCGAKGVFGQSSGAASGVELLIEQALRQNREILATQQRVAEARGWLRQAGARPAPTLEVNTATGRALRSQGESEYTVGYFQPLETGGKRAKRMLAAEQAVAVAEAELAERGRLLAYDIKSRHIEVIASQRKVEAIARISSVNREAYRLVDARVQRDDAAPLERQLLLVELNRTEAQGSVAGGQARAALVELRRTAGIAVEGAFTPPSQFDRPPPVAATLEGLQRRALDLRPDLRAVRALASQAAAEFAVARAQGSPDVTLSAQYARRYEQLDDPVRLSSPGTPLSLTDQDNVLIFGISVPLGTRGRNKGNVEAATAREHAARLRVEQLMISIPLEVEAAWTRQEAASRAAAILNGGVLDEAKKNLSVIRQAYQLGELRLLDVLAEQRRLLETELSVIDAEAELARSRAELERAVGGDTQ